MRRLDGALVRPQWTSQPLQSGVEPPHSMGFARSSPLEENGRSVRRRWRREIRAERQLSATMNGRAALPRRRGFPFGRRPDDPAHLAADSPRLARRRLPWVEAGNGVQPRTGLWPWRAFRRKEGSNRVAVGTVAGRGPKAARGEQPWAGRHSSGALAQSKTCRRTEAPEQCGSALECCAAAPL
jgi:hypothetical protein